MLASEGTGKTPWPIEWFAWNDMHDWDVIYDFTGRVQIGNTYGR